MDAVAVTRQMLYTLQRSLEMQIDPVSSVTSAMQISYASPHDDNNAGSQMRVNVALCFLSPYSCTRNFQQINTCHRTVRLPPLMYSLVS